jgi:hypothetical protein
LSSDNRALVSNYNILTSARAVYDKLKAADDQRIADEKAAQEAIAQAEKAEREAAAQAELDRIANETVSQKNAIRTAKDYLNYTAFSWKGLIHQLEYEGYSNADATYGANYCGADWMVQAEKMAKSYLDYTSFSRQGLIHQLEFEGFTHEQAVHGVDTTGL